MVMKKALLVLTLLVLKFQAADLDYTKQNQWGGVCQTGQKQSPIDFIPHTSDYCSDKDFLYFQYDCTDIDFTTGTGQSHKIQTNNARVFMSSSFDVSASSVSQSTQLHFHAPSEHKVNGQQFQLEMHIVTFPIADTATWDDKIDESIVDSRTGYTKAEVKALITGSTKPVAVVIGYFFQVSDSVTENKIIDSNNKINLKKVFDCTANGFYYRYYGSLTTDPCTEGVEFAIYRRPILISQAEYEKIKNQIKSDTASAHQPNARDIQDLNDRTVRLSGPACYPKI